jgi:hypothetical protein
MEKEIIKFLWDILDDIDSTGDIAKFNDRFYRERVEKLQKKRWQTGITTDGYTLDLTEMKVPKNIEGWVPSKTNSSIVGKLIEELSKDQSEGSYYHSWKSNIAMAFYDTIYQQDKGNDGLVLPFDLHEVSNKVAENFLQQLIK